MLETFGGHNDDLSIHPFGSNFLTSGPSDEFRLRHSELFWLGTLPGRQFWLTQYGHDKCIISSRENSGTLFRNGRPLLFEDCESKSHERSRHVENISRLFAATVGCACGSWLFGSSGGPRMGHVHIIAG